MTNTETSSDLVKRLHAALELLTAEDSRQTKLHDLLETIREQIRLDVAPEHRPSALFTNIQNAVYAMRGRTPLLDDAAIVETLREAADALTSPTSGERDDDLTPLMQRSIAAFAKLSPEEQEAHMKLQRESWVRGEMSIGSDKDEAEARMTYRHKKRRFEAITKEPS